MVNAKLVKVLLKLMSQILAELVCRPFPKYLLDSHLSTVKNALV